uniref:Uncharacterized protein n=1 Tax=Oryza glaberrima TaxID=4538 RepID=I1P2F6_ORYGL
MHLARQWLCPPPRHRRHPPLLSRLRKFSINSVDALWRRTTSEQVKQQPASSRVRRWRSPSASSPSCCHQPWKRCPSSCRNRRSWPRRYRWAYTA